MEDLCIYAQHEEKIGEISMLTGLSKKQIIELAIEKYLDEYDLSNSGNSLINKEEIWKDVKDWEDSYQVSNLGRVRSKIRKTSFGKTCPSCILRPGISVRGYLRAGLCQEGRKTKMKSVHRMVCEAFLPNPEDKPVVHHKNNIRSDNRLENLQWATISENALFAQETENNWRGENHKGSKLDNKQVLEIREKYRYRTYSYRKLAREYGVSMRLIVYIVKRLNWKHI